MYLLSNILLAGMILTQTCLLISAESLLQQILPYLTLEQTTLLVLYFSKERRDHR